MSIDRHGNEIQNPKNLFKLEFRSKQSANSKQATDRKMCSIKEILSNKKKCILNKSTCKHTHAYIRRPLINYNKLNNYKIENKYLIAEVNVEVCIERQAHLNAISLQQ